MAAARAIGPPPTALPALPVTFRPFRGRIMILVTGVTISVALTVLAIVLPPPGPTTDGFMLRDRLGFAVIGLVVVGGLALLARPHVVAREDGLEVVNVRRRRRLGWAQVVHVRLAPGDPWMVLDLDDGTSLPAMGVQTADGDRGRRAAATIAALVATHAGRRSTT